MMAREIFLRPNSRQVESMILLDRKTQDFMA